MSTRVDPLINELCAGCLQAESAAIKASFVEGLGAVMSQLGVYILFTYVASLNQNICGRSG